MSTIEKLEELLVRSPDNVLLRFGLGKAYLDNGQADKAIDQLEQVVRLDPNYSAAWKLYGKTLAAAGRTQEAMDAYSQGQTVAHARGDLQAAKEMAVFLKRLKSTNSDRCK